MTNNVGRIFEFENVVDGGSLFVNAPERFSEKDSSKVLDKYLDWYENDFLISEPDYLHRFKEDYKFVRCFEFIDFYDDLNGESEC